MLTTKTCSIAGFRGVQCLNAVVWVVEDLCHMSLLDGPIARVMGYGMCATTVIERLEIFFFFYFLFYLCRMYCKNRKYIID